MIRRSLRNGLLAAFAVVAVFPVAAVASAGPAAQAHALNSTPPQISVPAWQPAPAPSTLPARPKAPAVPKAPKCHHGRHHAKGRAARHHQHIRHVRHVHGVRRITRNHAWGYVATHRLPLNVRSGPGTGYRVVGSRSVGSSVALTCKVRGSGVRGNHRWYRLAHHRGWVSARYVHNLATVRWC
ncbi:SH3 domain-containing protein [Streptomyces sp. NPDC001351]|uniref:SH3 domain-containing protein n=1 Tax=Streptomyces sp. NPDC001351 TaxID=3364564 RepID=UPI00368172CE